MGDRFIGFDRFAKASLGSKNDTMKGKPIDKLEMELSSLREIQGGDANLLLSFADCGLKSRLAGFQATAWPIDLASAQPSFLSDHQDLTLS